MAAPHGLPHKHTHLWHTRAHIKIDSAPRKINSYLMDSQPLHGHFLHCLLEVRHHVSERHSQINGPPRKQLTAGDRSLHVALLFQLQSQNIPSRC